MSRLDGRRLAVWLDDGSENPAEANAGVSGWEGVGIIEGDIQSGGPPPYSRAIHTLFQGMSDYGQIRILRDALKC